MSQQIQITPEQVQEIIKEYDFDTDDVFEFDDELKELSAAIKKLSLPDRIIILLYAHFASQRKVGKVLGVSHSVVGQELKRIREKIFEILNGE
ncbi:MAG: hypothetical protein J6Y78_03175 [Paludibacteraceae bacterium]|nr:hypothetical protein [Paludibacteraceae bacterium]